jgi:hypothetical protein
MHFVEKKLLFNREVRYKIHSGSGLAGSGSEMIYSGSESGSCKKFRFWPDPDPVGSGSTHWKGQKLNLLLLKVHTRFLV